MLHQLRNLIDVAVHRVRGAVRIAPPQGGDDRLVPLDRSRGPPFLLKRQLPRLDQQIVERRHDAHDDPVLRRARERRVKRGVLGDRRSARFELPPLDVDDALQIGEVLVGVPRRGHAGDRRLEHPADVEQLFAQIAAVGQHRGQRRNQPVDVELVRKGSLAVPRLDEADCLEHAQGVADRAAADAKARRELPLAGERPVAGQGAVENQLTDAIGDFLGDTRLPYGLNEPLGPLDTPAAGCQTAALDWSDHWASVAQCGFSGMRIEFTAAGSAKVLSRAIEEFARSQGNVNALVVPWESDATRLSMAVTSVKTDGWAIEHTTLGTITLSSVGDETTRVAIQGPEQTTHDEPKLAAVFDRFARQLQKQLATAP